MKKVTKIISFALSILLILQIVLPMLTNIEMSTSYAETLEYVNSFEGNAYSANVQKNKTTRYWSRSTGYSSSAKNFGATSSSKVPLFENIYLTKGSVVRFEVYGSSCNHVGSNANIYISDASLTKLQYNENNQKNMIGTLTVPASGGNGNQSKSAKMNFQINTTGYYTADAIGIAYGCDVSSGHGIRILPTYEIYKYKYDINYNLNGGNLSFANKSSYYQNDTDFTLNNPTKIGYTFTGWIGTGLSSPTETVTIPIGSEGDRKYTATWTPSVYTITLDNQLATNTGTTSYYQKYSIDNYTSLDCSRAISKITVPTKNGYTFDGYYTQANGEGTQYIKADGTIISANNTFTEDTTLIANWKKNNYNLKVELNGGICEKITNNQEFIINYEETIEIPTPKRNGYTFIGWDLEGKESKISMTDKDRATFTMGNSNAILTAKWKLITNNITGKVIWNDQENTYHTRPIGNIEITLQSDEPVTVKEALQTPNTQKVEKEEYTFRNVQVKKEKDNTDYIYTISQNKILGYETIIDGNNIINNLILPSYTSEVKMTPFNKEENTYIKGEPVQITGTVTVLKNNQNKVGLCDEEVIFAIDEGITINKNTIKINYIDKEGKIKEINKYTIEGNTIKVSFESNRTSDIITGDSLKLELNGTLGEKEIYTNEISYGGNLRNYETGENTNINLGIVTKAEETITDIVEKSEETKNKVRIALKDIETEKYIEGATLQIIKKIEKDGKVVEKIVEEWTTEEDKIYEGLPEGNYIIRETKLPEDDKGYVTIEDTPIKIENRTEEQKVELKQDFTKVAIEIIDEETKEKINNLEIEAINKETEEVTKAKETEEGYLVERIPEGDYIVRQKTPEGYKEIEDIEIKIQGTGKKQIKTIENKKLIYDIQVKQELESITINGEKKKITKGEIQKIEIKTSNIDTEDIKLDYVIRVSNVGEVKASLGKIINNLPEGFKLVSTDWKQEGNQAILDAKGEELKPGESKEVRITLQWENSASNFGKKKNTVEIKESTNPYGYEDKNTDNNVGEEVIIFSIKTGSDELITIIKIVDIILALGIVMCFMINRKK